MDIGLAEHFRAPRPQIPTPDGRKEEGHRKGLLDVRRRNKAQGAVTPQSLTPKGQLCAFRRHSLAENNRNLRIK